MHSLHSVACAMQLNQRSATASAGRALQRASPLLRGPRAPAASGDKGDGPSPSGSSGRQPWDVGRFARTLTFFNPPPSLRQLLQTALVDTPARVIRRMQGVPEPQAQAGVVPVPLGFADASPATALAPEAVPDVKVDGIIMVTGATGGVGRRVVQRLLAAGQHVRVLVRDVAKAQSMLSTLSRAPGAKLELCPADLTQQSTLQASYFQGVRALVVCSAVKVQPKEGDTPDRQKYLQGIKFYDPTIADDSPEAVELKGMRYLLAAAAPHLGLQEGLSILNGDGSGLQVWGALDDVVMGGVSLSGIESVAGRGEEPGQAAMVFRGNVSTNNSGGFASVRCRNFEPALDLGAYEGIEMRLKGDGQRYKLILRTDPGWDSIAYCHSFDTKPGVWQTVRIPFKDFFPVFRARTLKDGTVLDPRTVYSIQLMLSKFEYDGDLNPSFRAGAFELPITRIAAFSAARHTPRLVHLSSAGVTRPNRPGIDVSQEPPAVRMNDELGGILTYKLAGEDVVRGSGVPFAVVRPCALTEEPRGAPLELDQGDMVKGKVSREDVAELCCALLNQPAALGCTFEVKSTVPFSEPWSPSTPAPKRDWASLLQGAQLVPGVTGKTIDGRYTGKAPEAQFVEQAQVV